MSKLTILSSNTDKRQAKIRKARSVNDLLGVLSEITQEVGENTRMVSGLIKSLSATRKPVSEAEEIRISHTGKGALPTSTKISTKTTPSGDNLGVKLEKFVVPPLKVLQPSVDVVQSLYDNARELDSVEALLSQSFIGAKNQPQALRAVRTLKAEVDKSILQALKAVNAIASKHLPTEMKRLNTKIIGYVLDTVEPSSYSDITETVYVVPVDSQLHFSLYLCLQDLKDGKGFIYTEFYVVLTGVVEKGAIKYYLNTLPDFKVPGTYEKGKEVLNEKAAVTRVRFLFSANDILSDEERRPLPVTTQDLKSKNLHLLPSVQGVDVKDDTILVHLKSGTAPSKVNELVTTVLPMLRSVVGLTGRSRSVFKWKTVKKGPKTSLEFILTPDIRSDEKAQLSLNLTKLHELQSALDLTPEELGAVKKALKSFL